jgi:hypothetical protein
MKRIVFAVLLTACLALSVHAKKMVCISFNKGEMPDDVNKCECTLTEENVEKTGDTSLKLTLGAHGWAGLDKPKKGSWKDFTKCKFVVVNPTDKPIENIGFMIKGAKMTDTPENRKDWNFTLKPGKNELEVSLVDQKCNDGKSTLDVTRLLRWCFWNNSENEKVEIYVLKVWVVDNEEK